MTDRIKLLNEDLELLNEVKEYTEPLKLEKILSSAKQFNYLDEYLFWYRHEEVYSSFEEYLVNEIEYLKNK